MIIETKVRKIGNSLGMVLPKEALQAMDAVEGTKLFLTPAPHGALRVTVDKPGFEKKAKIADSLMRRYRNTFRELAK